MCKELEELNEKYRSGQELSESDMKKIDMLYHALKSMATYNAMKESEDYGMSYETRDNRSYNDGGYSGRRSMDMGRGYSGHYPPMMPMPYYEGNRW